MEKKRSARRGESGATGLDGALKRIERVVRSAEKAAEKAGGRKGVEDLVVALGARVARVKAWMETAGEVKEEIGQMEGLAKMLEGSGAGESEGARGAEPGGGSGPQENPQGSEDALTRRIRSM